MTPRSWNIDTDFTYFHRFVQCSWYNPCWQSSGNKRGVCRLSNVSKSRPWIISGLTWSFSGTTNDVMSTSTDVVGKRYETRITLNQHTGSLVLTNLMEDDSGEYELIIIPYGGQQLQGTATFKVLRKSDPKNKLHTTVNNWACLLNYEFMLPECDASHFKKWDIFMFCVHF